MKKLVFLCLAILPFCAYGEHEDKTYSIRSKNISFELLPAVPALISKNCVENEQVASCDASRAMKAANIKKLAPKEGEQTPELGFVPSR